jgi:ribosome-associated protein
MHNTKKLDPYIEAAIVALADKKAMNIMLLDVKGLSSITDMMIIAEGFVDRHVVALAGACEKALKEMGKPVFKQEGMHSGEWVVLDYFDFMIHLFAPGFRDRYEIEKLWPEAQLIDITDLVKSHSEV